LYSHILRIGSQYLLSPLLHRMTGRIVCTQERGCPISMFVLWRVVPTHRICLRVTRVAVTIRSQDITKAYYHPSHQLCSREVRVDDREFRMYYRSYVPSQSFFIAVMQYCIYLLQTSHRGHSVMLPATAYRQTQSQ